MRCSGSRARCRRRGRGADREEERAPALATVSNDSWFTLDVYAADQASRQRLGTVSSFDSLTFEIPDHMVRSSGEIQLLADSVGSTRI